MTDAVSGTIKTTRHAQVRYRYGCDCGDVFKKDDDFDGTTLTIECASMDEAEAMLAAISQDDHALALVAEAYEVAAVIASDNVPATVKAAAIRAMTPSDAFAAREADRARVRDEALREAAAVAEKYDQAATCMSCADTIHILCEILALIEGGQTDE